MTIIALLTRSTMLDVLRQDRADGRLDERLAVAAVADLAEEHGTAAVELDRERQPIEMPAQLDDATDVLVRNPEPRVRRLRLIDVKDILATVEEVNAALKAASEGALKGVLGSTYPGLDEIGWTKLTRNWAIFFAVMAVVNESVWRNSSTQFWIGFKIWGAIPLTFLFALANVPMLLRHGLTREDAVPAEPGPVE